MANFTYLKKSDNLVESATVTASSEDSDFLGTNAAALPNFPGTNLTSLCGLPWLLLPDESRQSPSKRKWATSPNFGCTNWIRVT